MSTSTALLASGRAYKAVLQNPQASAALLQPWKLLRDQIKAADEAANAAGGERPFIVARGDENPYPATAAMRKNGGWYGPLADAHKVRTRDGKADGMNIGEPAEK